MSFGHMARSHSSYGSKPFHRCLFRVVSPVLTRRNDMVMDEQGQRSVY